MSKLFVWICLVRILSCEPGANKKVVSDVIKHDTLLKVLDTSDDYDAAYDIYYHVDSLKKVKVNTETLEGKIAQWRIMQIILHNAVHPEETGIEQEPEVMTADIDGDGEPELLAEGNCSSCGTGNYNFCQSVYFMNRELQLFEDTPRIELENPVWYRKQMKVYSYYMAVPFISGEAFRISRNGELKLFEKIDVDETENGSFMCSKSDGNDRLLFEKSYTKFKVLQDVDVFPAYKILTRKPFGLY